MGGLWRGTGITTRLDATCRPRHLNAIDEVDQWGRELGGVDSFLREFLDEFYVEHDETARSAMLQEEPPLGAALRSR